MPNPSLTQSQKRTQESIKALFQGEGPKKFLFIKSSSDTGVIRNGGRNGARFAPQSFLSTFKKFSQDNACQDYSFLEFEVSDSDEEKRNFTEAQKQESLRISRLLKEYPEIPFCHLGGGHDHVYPLLRALSETSKKIIVINIDAHADTRTDDESHSGTPFRQFSREFPGEFSLFQIGLHPFANSFSTLSPLEKGKQEILWRKDITAKALEEFFFRISSLITRESLVLFSIDADALNGAEVPGVSAVNPAGISREELLLMWSNYRSLPFTHAPMMGIYELNPVYDSLASISMRTMGSFVFETLRE